MNINKHLTRHIGTVIATNNCCDIIKYSPSCLPVKIPRHDSNSVIFSIIILSGHLEDMATNA